MWWRRCVWHSVVYFLWLTHREWLQDILPSSSSNPFQSSSSWLTHSTLRPHLFYTDTLKETQLERKRIKFLICPCLLFQTSSRGRLPLSLLCYPPLSPSNLLPETRDTPNFTPSPLFSASWPALLWHWMCDRLFSQRLRKFLSLPRSRLVKTHTVTAQLVLNFPTAAFFFWHLCPFFFKNLKAAESQQGKNSIHPILREQAETVQRRWWKTEIPLRHASSSSRNLKSQHVFRTINHLLQTFPISPLASQPQRTHNILQVVTVTIKQ